MARDGREVRVWDESFVAGADLSGDQFRVVKIDADNDGEVDRAGAGQGIGILQDHNKAGREASVRLLGMSKGLSGASFGNGVELAANSSGKLVSASSGNLVICTSNTTSTGADQLVEVLLTGIYEKN